MSAAGKQHIADRKADASLQRDLARARDALTRLAGTERFTWEATAACVALSAMARLEALAMDALNELKEGEQMKIKKVDADSRIPTVANEGDGAFDMYANQDSDLYPGEKEKVSLGVHVEIPAGHVGLLVPRSSTGSKGLHLANGVGVIDSSYRGEVIANLHNISNDHIGVSRFDRVCQMLIVPVITPALQVVEDLSETTRGVGGFGSSGK